MGYFTLANQISA